MSRHREPSPASRICFAKEERRESSTTASPARQGGAFLATDEGTRVPLRKAPQGGASSGTSSQARAQSSAGMAELGRRKGKAPVVTKAWNRGKVGIRNRKLRAVCAFSNTQTVRFRYRDISANWRRRGRRGAAAIYLRGGRSASCRADWHPDIRRTGVTEYPVGITRITPP